MKDYSNNQRIAKASSALLGLLMLAGLVLPMKADYRLSPAVDIIASDFRMAANGVVGTDIYFSPQDFSEALGLKSVDKITVAVLPDATLGRLQLGTRYVEVGQTISERDIDDLKFVPFGSNEIAATFGFCVGKNTKGPIYKCTVYTTEKVNIAPTVSIEQSVPTSGGEITAYTAVTHHGTVFADDPEGDPLTFEVVSKPLNGTVRFTDSSRGYYEYTSDDGFSGKDSFTVRVTDKYGNRSVSEKITLRVDEPAAGEVYADMKGHYANAAVISCIRAGIINSASEGEYFYPDEYISRAEFLSLAMDAVGYSGLSATKTGFADDADIPQEYKGVVAAAHALGFVDGIESAEGLRFYPNNQITRSEAAVILSRLTGITSDITPVFSDMSVPAWAQSSVQGLNAAGILRGTGSGSIDAYASVTRGAAAQMLSVCMMH